MHDESLCMWVTAQVLIIRALVNAHEVQFIHWYNIPKDWLKHSHGCTYSLGPTGTVIYCYLTVLQEFVGDCFTSVCLVHI